MRIRTSRPVRVVAGGVAVLVATATAMFAMAPAHASTSSRHYDTDISQSCGWQTLGHGRFVPADVVDITVTDWEDPVDYVNFDVNFAYQVQSDPILPPGNSTPVGSVHISHGTFVQHITFNVVFPNSGEYLRINDSTPWAGEYHIRQMPNCGSPS